MADTKISLRQTLKDSLLGLDPNQRKAESALLVRLISGWAVNEGFEVLLGTLPFPEEPDLRPLYETWLASGRRVALARTGPSRTLSFHYIQDLSGPWDQKPFGTLEPLAVTPEWAPGPRTLCLVPGLGFAPGQKLPQGTGLTTVRLGRGGGYYDRWLARFGTDVFRLGVGFTVQSMKSLPVEDHDQGLDGWADPLGFHGF